MKLKVCGMKYKDNIEAVAKLQPDYLGFIFYDKSSRFFDSEIPNIPNTVKKVGVFVDEELEIVLKKIKQFNLQTVQLHGNESPNYCSELKTLCHFEQSEKSHHGVPQSQISFRDDKSSAIASTLEIIKVFSIKDKFDFSILKPYENVCDYFLFDTKGELPGGNGYVFNWDVLVNYPSTKPYILSGGIGLNEIEKIKEFRKSTASKHCYAIDVNSKFEIEAGLKDIEELEKFKNATCHVERN
jgi:phosphoribosylanthranilate isomerase